MRSKQKELLIRARPELLQTLDVSHVLPALRESGHITAKDEANITSDTARRKRVINNGHFFQGCFWPSRGQCTYVRVYYGRGLGLRR